VHIHSCVRRRSRPDQDRCEEQYSFHTEEQTPCARPASSMAH
jgi:hypothetical protein